MLTNLYKKKLEYFKLWKMNSKTEEWMVIQCFYKDILGYIHSECNRKGKIVEKYKKLYTIINDEIVKHCLKSDYFDFPYSKKLINNYYMKIFHFLIKRRSTTSLLIWIIFYNKFLYPVRLKFSVIQKSLISIVVKN